MSTSPSGRKRKAWDLNPHPREGARFSKPARPAVSDYLPFSEPAGTRTRISAAPGRCRPFGPRARLVISGPDGSRTHRTDLAGISRLHGTCQPTSSRGPSGSRTRSSSLPRRCAAETPTDHQVIPAGIEPALSWLSPRRLCRWTTRSQVTEVGLEPTGTRLSTSPLCQFAYPVVAGPGVAPGGPGL